MKEYDFSHYMETSSKTGQNVENLFFTLTKHLYLVNDTIRVEDGMPDLISPIEKKFTSSFQS